MAKSMWFWVIFAVCVIAAILLSWPFAPASGVVLAIFVLIFLLGLGVYGGPVQ